MKLSCCIWALSDPIDMTLTKIAAAGFEWIDVRPIDLTPAAAQAKAKELGLKVVCMGVAFGLPEGASLDSADETAREKAVVYMTESLTKAAHLGATDAYVVPGLDGSPEALGRYGQSLLTLADRAADLKLRLSIEHFPGRALPTIAATLDFLAQLNHPNLYLLFDIGHAQMSGEDPAEAIRQAGPRLGYVHLDDNDGQGDLHLALFDGVLTEATLRRTFAALVEVGYQGGVSLELSPKLANPLGALRRDREMVAGLL